MNRFNRRTQQAIEAIYNSFLSSLSDNYSVEMYDYENGIMLEFLDENQQCLNKILFYPQHPFGQDIWSIAIYGINLLEKYDYINNSRTCFGLPVIDVRYDTEGLTPFVDVYIGNY